MRLENRSALFLKLVQKVTRNQALEIRQNDAMFGPVLNGLGSFCRWNPIPDSGISWEHKIADTRHKTKFRQFRMSKSDSPDCLKRWDKKDFSRTQMQIPCAKRFSLVEKLGADTRHNLILGVPKRIFQEPSYVRLPRMASLCYVVVWHVFPPTMMIVDRDLAISASRCGIPGLRGSQRGRATCRAYASL